jgi:hypothetical protein
LPDLLVDVGPRGVSGPLNGKGIAPDGLALGGQLSDPALGVLELFHDLELDVLERRLPPAQRGDLALQLLELPRRGHLAGVQPALVAVLSLAHLVDIGIGPLLLLLEVRHLGLGRNLGIAQPAVLGGQGIQFGDLRQRPAPVGELVEFGVQRLELKQALLGGRISVQWNFPPRASRRAASTDLSASWTRGSPP